MAVPVLYIPATHDVQPPVVFLVNVYVPAPQEIQPPFWDPWYPSLQVQCSDKKLIVGADAFCLHGLNVTLPPTHHASAGHALHVLSFDL